MDDNDFEVVKERGPVWFILFRIGIPIACVGVWMIAQSSAGFLKFALTSVAVVLTIYALALVVIGPLLSYLFERYIRRL